MTQHTGRCQEKSLQLGAELKVVTDLIPGQHRNPLAPADTKDLMPISMKAVAVFQSSWWEALGAALQGFLEEAGWILSPCLVGPEIKTTTSFPAPIQTQLLPPELVVKFLISFIPSSCKVYLWFYEYFIGMPTFPRNFRPLYFYFLVCFTRE